MSITDIEAIEMSRKLAEYHKDLAIEAALWKGVRPLDLVHEYHSDLAERLTIEVTQIPERIVAVKRAKERYRAIDDGWLGAK